MKVFIRSSSEDNLYLLSLLSIFLISPLVMYFHETNLPPQIHGLRIFINLIFLVLAAGYYRLLLQRKEIVWNARKFLVPALMGILCCFLYPVFSGDIIEYLIRGRMLTIHGLNPFAHVPSEVPKDILFPLCFAPEVGQIYGPLALGMQAIAVFIGKNSLTMMIFAFKAQLLVFLALGGYYLEKIARRLGTRGIGAAFALNPMIIIFTLMDGHNDIAMVAMLIMSISLLLEKRFTAAFLAWSCSFLVKYLSLIALPFMIIYALKTQKNERPLWRFALKQVLINAAFVGVAFGVIWGGENTYSKLGILVTKFFDNCFPYAVHQLLTLLGLPVAQSTVKFIFSGGYFIALIGLMFALAVDKNILDKRLIKTVAWAFGLIYLSMTNALWGWYFIWTLPWILLSEIHLWELFITLYSLVALFSYFKRPNYLIALAALFYLAILSLVRFRKKVSF